MRSLFLAALYVVVVPGLVRGVTPTGAELDERRRWVSSAFEGITEKFDQNDRPHLTVLENHDVVQKNARGSKPLRLGQDSYTSGLYCHASSKVVLRDLPAPAKRFTATIGVVRSTETVTRSPLSSSNDSSGICNCGAEFAVMAVSQIEG